MVQVPVVTKVKAPPEVMVQTLVVLDEKLMVKPEFVLAVKVGVVPKFWLPGLVKVIFCMAFGVTELDALEAELVPILLVAVTVKV